MSRYSWLYLMKDVRNLRKTAILKIYIYYTSTVIHSLLHKSHSFCRTPLQMLFPGMHVQAKLYFTSHTFLHA